MAQTKKEVLLIRHGQSVTNETENYQAGDQFEIDPLNKTGERQGSLLAAEFESQGYTPDIILTSYYKRAMQTAQYIGRVTGARIVVPVYDDAGRIADKAPDAVTASDGKSLLRELDLPAELEGRPYTDEAAQTIKTEINEHLYDQDWHYSNEENLYDIWHRAGLAKQYIAERAEQKIALFSHGGFIKALIAHVLIDDHDAWSLRQKLEVYRTIMPTMWVDNTGIVSLFQQPSDGSWQWLISYNRHLHSSFGFMNNEPEFHAETSSDELHTDS